MFLTGSVLLSFRLLFLPLLGVGLQAGDVIVSLNGTPVDGTMDDFLGLVRREHLVGDPITLGVLRDGKAVDLRMTLK